MKFVTLTDFQIVSFVLGLWILHVIWIEGYHTLWHDEYVRNK